MPEMLDYIFVSINKQSEAVTDICNVLKKQAKFNRVAAKSLQFAGIALISAGIQGYLVDKRISKLEKKVRELEALNKEA